MTPRYLDRVGAAEYLSERGINIKPGTLARWACTGRYRLPMLKIGTLVRYDRADLDALIEAHRVTPGGL